MLQLMCVCGQASTENSSGGSGPDSPFTEFTSHLGRKLGGDWTAGLMESPPHGNLMLGERRFLLRLQLNVPLE